MTFPAKPAVLILICGLLLSPVHTAVAGPDGPMTWNTTVSLGGGWGRMIRLTNGNWLAVNTLFPAGTNSYLRMSRSTDNARTWTTLSNVKEAGRTLDNGELIQLPDGTVLLTMRSLITTNSYELHVYASGNNGASWTYRSNIDTSSGANAAAGNGLWEPDFLVLDDGRLVVTYSNETHPGYSQLISLRVSDNNGTTWGPETWAVNQVGGGNLRPGMSQIARMANGEYILVYEVVNSGNADVHCKFSADGINWPVGMGTRIPCQHCGPFVLSLTNGLVVLSSCENQISFSEDYGRTWQKAEPPGWDVGFLFTWPALYQTQTNEIALMVVSNGTKIRFGSLTPRPLWENPFLDDFNDGTDAGWSRYGGNFALTNGRFVLSNEGTTGKAMTGDNFWSEGILEADLQITSPGNAGLMFRTTNPDYSGPDAAFGYFVGLDTAGSVLLGKMNNGWSFLTNKSMTVSTNSTYHLKVTLAGNLISVFVDDMAVPRFSYSDGTYERGQIGIRAHQCDAQFDNVTFSNAAPLQLSLQSSNGNLTARWPETSVTMKLVSSDNIQGNGQALTNLPALVNGEWSVALPATTNARQFYWLRAE